MNIQELISKLANTDKRRFTEIYIGKVTSVNKDLKTCDVDVLNTDKVDVLKDVQLNIDFDTVNIKNYVLPTIGSTVLVIYQESIGGVAFNYTKIDTYNLSANQSIKLDVITENIIEIEREKINLQTPTTQLLMGNSEMKMEVKSDTSSKAVVITPDSVKIGSINSNKTVVSALKILVKLNNIIQDINKYKDNIKSWTAVPGDGGTSFKTKMLDWSIQQLPNITESDIKTADTILTD